MWPSRTARAAPSPVSPDGRSAYMSYYDCVAVFSRDRADRHADPLFDLGCLKQSRLALLPALVRGLGVRAALGQAAVRMGAVFSDQVAATGAHAAS